MNLKKDLKYNLKATQGKNLGGVKHTGYSIHISSTDHLNTRGYKTATFFLLTAFKEGGTVPTWGRFAAHSMSAAVERRKRLYQEKITRLGDLV